MNFGGKRPIFCYFSHVMYPHREGIPSLFKQFLNISLGKLVKCLKNKIVSRYHKLSCWNLTSIFKIDRFSKCCFMDNETQNLVVFEWELFLGRPAILISWRHLKIPTTWQLSEYFQEFRLLLFFHQWIAKFDRQPQTIWRNYSESAQYSHSEGQTITKGETKIYVSVIRTFSLDLHF